ncbi:MAG: site-specific integrase [Erysipelotrichaceae bacterium]|nr:site-specific integrase [Erysipelotrichaceae bacterium]
MIDAITFTQEWLDIKRNDIKPISYDKYEVVIKNYLVPFLKKHPIDTLNESIINQYLNNELNGTLSQRTIYLIKSVLKLLYNYAEEKYHLKHIDFSIIKVDITQKQQTLDSYQEKIIYDYCCNHIDALSVSILLCLYGGLRFSEICALRYSDIDLDHGLIHINKKVQRKKERGNRLSKTIFSTETLDIPEKRIVALSDFMIAYLKKFMIYSEIDCYLLNQSQKLPEQRLYQRQLKALGQKYDLEVTYLMLRNTCKEKCIQNNVDMNTVLKTLGITKIIINVDNDKPIDIHYNQKQMEKLIPR